MLSTSASFRNDTHWDDSSISLSEIISALSYALDLTEGAVHGHSLRSCLLGMRIAAEAKLSDDQTSSLYFALLLKDIGRDSTAAGRMSQTIGGGGRRPNLATFKLLWKNILPTDGPAMSAARRLRSSVAQHGNNEQLLDLHCDRGASILAKLGMGQSAAQAVRRLDEHWDGSAYPDGLQHEQIPLLARICAIAQHLDVFSSRFGVERAIETLKRGSGTWFDPQLVNVAFSLHRRGALWANCKVADSQDD